MKKYKYYLKPLARGLRAEATTEEIILWEKIRRKQVLGIQFYRQRPVVLATIVN